ncbi:glutathione S-transferase family protein [Hahella ganghwensis]|uniref:glutathione S-transferase family protein n=1 Tax=Hahella ganghwensis TaxID=286420 RepID=UPI00037F1270|nr:glutathione S-transferase [Hahella ganghwensis]
MSRPVPQQPVKLYQYPLSGHCHRVQLFLSILNLPYELVMVDLLKGEHKQPSFLELNAFGQVPVMDDSGIILADSNAILVYLASRYDDGAWLPTDPERAGTTQRWLSVAATALLNGPGSARLITLFGAKLNVEEALKKSADLLAIMEAELSRREFFVGSTPTIADIAMYTYTAHAPEGNVSLEPYPHVLSWLKRIEALPGFVPMEQSPVGLYAQ